jgi:hypothetical protein
MCALKLKSQKYGGTSAQVAFVFLRARLVMPFCGLVRELLALVNLRDAMQAGWCR